MCPACTALKMCFKSDCQKRLLVVAKAVWVARSGGFKIVAAPLGVRHEQLGWNERSALVHKHPSFPKNPDEHCWGKGGISCLITGV